MLGDCCRRTRNDRRTGLFIRSAGQISRKIRGIRVAARFLQNWTLSGLAHRRAGPQGGVYERLTLREQKSADTETAKFIEEGKELFHSSDKLGGTIGVSCDMCHPDAANTDPETYPKYQTQLQRVALSRDMINWCIENPLARHRRRGPSAPAPSR